MMGVPSAVGVVPSSPRGPGRPRSGDADRAILAAALRSLAEDGYQAMTMESVAERAGVGKPTLYRRHATKANLVAAALVSVGEATETAQGGEARAALRSLMGAAAAAIAATGALTVLGSLLAEERHDPQLVEVFRRSVFRPRKMRVERVVADGIASGRLRPDVDPEVVSALLFGGLLARAMAGESLDAAWLDRAVDTIWECLAPEDRARG